MLRAIAATVLLAAATGNWSSLHGAAASPATAGSCASVNGWNLICGNPNPEDLVPVPGTRWLIASGMKEGAGLKLVDTDARTARIFYTGQPAQLRPDKTLFPNCPAPPDARSFNAHGIYLRRAEQPGIYRLYVVSHGALESIQVFTIDANGAQPSLTWTGCVPTGDVVEWKRGTDAFHVVQGTQLAGNNGIEISLDEKEFYVVAFGTHTVVAFSRQDPRKPLRQTVAPGFMPDNLRWSGNRLIAAGPMYDEPACGGTRLVVVDDPVLTSCHRGFMIAQLDPKTMAWTILAYAEPNPAISVVSTGVVMGGTLWIGSAASDAIAYRALPRPASGLH